MWCARLHYSCVRCEIKLRWISSAMYEEHAQGMCLTGFLQAGLHGIIPSPINGLFKFSTILAFSKGLLDMLRQNEAYKNSSESL
mmetsp:Transcript_36380/g.113403  ORF Transcript_36380/g.113403 Transcript_36380/m.113403 type:complete len:84 (-) Transcript_36380:696-947(-)